MGEPTLSYFPSVLLRRPVLLLLLLERLVSGSVILSSLKSDFRVAVSLSSILCASLVFPVFCLGRVWSCYRICEA